MAKNPEFVRLADHMVHGLCVDMDSGFSLSGYDVQPFPEEREQQRYVRRQINAGVMEPASQAEYDTAHPESDDDDSDEDADRFVEAVKAASGRGGKQEHRLREKETGKHEAIRGARERAKLAEAGYDVDEDEDADDEDFLEEQERREAIAAQQEEDGLDTDDPEEQKEATAERPAAKAEKSAKKTTKAAKKSK